MNQITADQFIKICRALSSPNRAKEVLKPECLPDWGKVAERARYFATIPSLEREAGFFDMIE